MKRLDIGSFIPALLPKMGYRNAIAFLHEKTCVLVGQSGVGKSSITSTFVPDRDIRVGETSAKGLGKHTTTMTRLFHLPHGGNLIDSPGVREFGLWHMNKDEILQGFVELKNNISPIDAVFVIANIRMSPGLRDSESHRRWRNYHAAF